MRIGIGVDGSSHSIAGVEFVAALPLRPDDHVLIIAVAEMPVLLGPRGHVPPPPAWRDELIGLAEARATQVADQAEDRLEDAPCRVETQVRRGHPADGLEVAAVERDLDLLVVGSRGRTGLAAALLGSVSGSLLHSMPTSILVARPPTSTPRRVLLAVDGSESSIDAARFLAEMPLPMDLDIRVLVSVTAWTDEYASIPAGDFTELVAGERRHAAEIADQALAILGEAGRSGIATVTDGDPRREILDAARSFGSDLIVTGARGLGGFAGLIHGSVSRGVSQNAACSTLVVRPRPAGQDAPA
jgi:nucleotide-binding universal stress UspA family protein